MILKLEYTNTELTKFDNENPVFFSYSVLDKLTTSLRNDIESKGRVYLWVTYVDNFFFNRKSTKKDKKCCLKDINYEHFDNIILKGIARRYRREIRDSKINLLVNEGTNNTSYSYIELGANEI